MIYLVCPSGCPKDEWLGGIIPNNCPFCGAARVAQDDNSLIQVLWSETSDPTSWGPY